MTKLKLTFTLFMIVILCQKIHSQEQKTSLSALFYKALTGTKVTTTNERFIQISLDNPAFEEISPKTLLKKYPDTQQFMVNDSVMVIKNKAVIEGFIADLVSDGDSRIFIKNFIFKEDVNLNINLYSNLENETFNSSRLYFQNCTFKKNIESWFSNFNISFNGCNLSKLSLINESLICPKISINNCKIDYFQIWTASPREVYITNNTIGYLEIDQTTAEVMQIIGNNFIGITNDLLKKGDSENNILFSSINGRRTKKLGLNNRDSIINSIKLNDSKLMHIYSESRTISDLFISSNTFVDPTHSKLIILDQPSVKMELVNNTFEAPLILASTVTDNFTMEDNTFYKVNMMAALPSAPEHAVVVSWKELKGKLYYQKDELTAPYNIEGKDQLGNSKDFFNLISEYSRLINIYKNYGNLEDANDAFLDMKALHLKRYKYLYKTQGGTTNFFRLKLNQLLSVYTKHGTDPAQAMTASLWIIIAFSIIYFFFPSDWDTKSKKKLLKDFHTFREKNEKGYIKPFFKMIKGLFQSFFNAITLSVNSFVTLGFGTIPTRGFAKYVCIFQGFLGWFLLSIFIVALINQILI